VVGRAHSSLQERKLDRMKVKTAIAHELQEQGVS
jgi:hypothetical protein